MSVCDPEVRALWVRTGEPVGVDPDGALLGGFSPHSRGAQAQVLTLHLTRQWRRDDRPGNRLGSEAGGAGGQWNGWPLLLKWKSEDGANQDTKEVPERGA